MKLSYDTPTLEIIKFQADDIIVTSLPEGGDFVGTAPDFGWGEWP